jgi:hypothetical protein
VKKALFILGGVTLALVLAVTLVVASADWHTIGQTPAGDIVSVGSIHKLKAGQRTALVRVQYKEPIDLPQSESSQFGPSQAASSQFALSQSGSSQSGSSPEGPFVEMRAFVRLHCADNPSASATEWFFSRDHNGRVVATRKVAHDDQFGQPSEGGFAQMVSDRVCGQPK